MPDIAMIPEADGDSTLLGQTTPQCENNRLCISLWASFQAWDTCRECVEGWLPKSVFSLGYGLSSLEAWFSTALDIEEVLSWAGGDKLHVMVADVIKSFDTVDRSILDCALGRLGFVKHSQVRLRFKLAACLGEPWCRDGGIPQGWLLSMVFIVALHVPWCRHLDALLSVKPQLYADDLKCSAGRPCALFEAARSTAQYVRSVGQDVSPGKCVLLSTSKSVRKAMKLGTFLGMVASGRFSWMSGTLVTLPILLGGLVPVLFLGELVRPRLGSLPLVLCLWGFMLSWGWLVVSIFLPVSMLPRPPVSLPRLLVLSGQPLCVQFGLLKCLLPTHLLSLISLMGLLGLILFFILFGLGFA